ncbi:MAG: hypothetical protein EOP51_14900 [Sphingobacteriales bacterium]|nr:MAG: hypothetical protein EOP51_14900 [Sphingobacteriales bacterium]
MNATAKTRLTTFLVTIVCFLSVGYTACKKTETTTIDECLTVQCQNGSTCFKGMCSCITGFEGSHCEIVTLDRFIGKWKMKERVVGSNKETNINVTRDYSITIDAVPDSKVSFYMNDFMGNTDYDKIVCTEGRNEKYEPANYKSFIFEKSQNIKISTGYATLKSGSGVVNDFGTNFEGKYIISYPENSTTLITDTVSYSADLVQ